MKTSMVRTDGRHYEPGNRVTDLHLDGSIVQNPEHTHGTTSWVFITLRGPPPQGGGYGKNSELQQESSALCHKTTATLDKRHRSCRARVRTGLHS